MCYAYGKFKGCVQACVLHEIISREVADSSNFGKVEFNFALILVCHSSNPSGSLLRTQLECNWGRLKNGEVSGVCRYGYGEVEIGIPSNEIARLNGT